MSKKFVPLWCEAHFEVKTCKVPQCRSTLGIELSKKCTLLWRKDVQSTFRSQNVKKHCMPRPLLEVEMLKKCTLLLREPHFQVKALKNTTCSDHSSKLRRSKSARRFGAKHISKLRLGPLLDIQMSFRVPGARDCAPCSEENVRVL